ncbi:hypothetical protein SeMB42_g06256 [Synchytrium endobioticum]|uniref:Cell division control protein 45 n=1 Tax=Synchytrium endobioticum TaxID=286115 RepID=A0A507CWT5_9FUNG|nr:hypothetical protein SeMB42_g06256 [Synchytrium endobioticum]TPX43578.1 hypothetical protein SeLEV6574_g04974 [Synchytrium endobioticum]
MVLVRPPSLRSLYENIRKDASNTSSAVLVLAASDVDSLCACKILTTLFKADCIPHKVIPVAGYADLGRANSNHVENHDELRSIVLLNCGGLVDLSEFFTLSDYAIVYLVDSHRPINLQNLFGNPRIVVVKDEDAENEDRDIEDLKKAFKAIEYSDEEAEEEVDNGQDEQDSDEQDSDEDNSDNPDKPKSRKRKKKHDWDINIVAAKRAKAANARRAKRDYQRTITDYYSAGTYYGTSVAEMIYILAEQLNRTSNQLLWLTILGMTDQYIHDRIETRKYRSKTRRWKEEVNRFNVDNRAEDDDERDTDSTISNSRTNNFYAARGADDAGIRSDDELRLMLFRHWTLSESMFHTSYIASRLILWKEKGRARLSSLLVKMGMPQKECNQLFSEMKVALKNTLKEKLVGVAPRYMLNDIQFPSFFKQYGYRTAISASDAVYAITALLDAGYESIRDHALMGEFNGSVNNNGGVGVGVTLAGVGVGMRIGAAAVGMRVSESVEYVADESGLGSDGAVNEHGTENESKSESERVKNFFVAYDALESVDLLYHGIQLAMHFQRALVRTGLSILEKRMIKTLKTYRMVVLTSASNGSLSIPSNSNGRGGLGGLAGDRECVRLGSSPLHLTRLASFLADASDIDKKRRLPFVLAAPSDKPNRYLIIGLAPQPKEKEDKEKVDTRRNPFGIAFQNTAAQANATISHDMFEASAVEVDVDDLATFMEILQRFA